MSHPLPGLLFALLILAPVVDSKLEADDLEFSRDVRPILSDRCFPCHGPNEDDRQGELRLDRADGPEGAYRDLYDSQAVKPGSLEESAVWYRITSEDDDVMPPPDSSKKRLDANQNRIIKFTVLKMINQHRRRGQMVQGNIEEALDLIRVQVHR